MPKKLYCDLCESEKGATEDDDGVILCALHRAKHDLVYARARYATTRKFVKDVWIKRLQEEREEVLELEKRVDILEILEEESYR